RQYAAVIIDSYTARMFVFGLRGIEAVGEIEGEKMRRTEGGGWSQARYQRHVDHHVVQHVKDVVDALDDITRTEGISRVVLAGDDVVIPVVRAQLPKHLEDKVCDVIRLEMTAGDPEVMQRTLGAVRAATTRDDAAAVATALDAQRAGGLGAVGADEVRTALLNGQVHELFISDDIDADVAEELVA